MRCFNNVKDEILLKKVYLRKIYDQLQKCQEKTEIQIFNN